MYRYVKEKIQASKNKTSNLIGSGFRELGLKTEEINIFKEAHSRKSYIRFELFLSIKLKSSQEVVNNLSSFKSPYLNKESREKVESEKLEFVIRHIKEVQSYYNLQVTNHKMSHDEAIRKTADQLSDNLFNDALSNFLVLPKTSFLSFARLLKRAIFQ